jgi:hypothetical protein
VLSTLLAFQEAIPRMAARLVEYRRSWYFWLFLPEWRTQNPLPAGAQGRGRSTPSIYTDSFENLRKARFMRVFDCSGCAKLRKLTKKNRLFEGYCTHRNSGAREWGRTITALRPPDFESGASASSATRARRERISYHQQRSTTVGLFGCMRTTAGSKNGSTNRARSASTNP